MREGGTGGWREGGKLLYDTIKERDDEGTGLRPQYLWMGDVDRDIMVVGIASFSMYVAVRLHIEWFARGCACISLDYG